MIPNLNMFFGKFHFKKGYLLVLFITICHLFFIQNIQSQNIDFVKITGVISGKGSNNTLFKAASQTIPSLAYIRAQRIDGPQDGFFVQSGDNIRYTSLSKVAGIPENLSRIRFTFLKADKKTLIPLRDFRVIINDIDGPNNEALAAKCNINLKHIATAYYSNLKVDNHPPDLNVVGSVEESDGPTSRVLFEFSKVAVIEFDNYANYGYLKDFDLNYSAYRIAKPFYVKCSDNVAVNSKSNNEILFESLKLYPDFKLEGDKIMVNINPIYFDFDRYNIRKEAEAELEKVVTLMKKYPLIKISLGSHTDSKADDLYNDVLSENRAQATKEWIISNGISAERLTAKGYGEKQLVNKCANNIPCTEAEHQLNRRTEFIVLNPEDFK